MSISAQVHADHVLQLVLGARARSVRRLVRIMAAPPMRNSVLGMSIDLSSPRYQFCTTRHVSKLPRHLLQIAVLLELC